MNITGVSLISFLNLFMQFNYYLILLVSSDLIRLQREIFFFAKIRNKLGLWCRIINNNINVYTTSFNILMFLINIYYKSHNAFIMSFLENRNKPNLYFL